MMVMMFILGGVLKDHPPTNVNSMYSHRLGFHQERMLTETPTQLSHPLPSPWLL
jgi:hypothetical protein